MSVLNKLKEIWSRYDLFIGGAYLGTHHSIKDIRELGSIKRTYFQSSSTVTRQFIQFWIVFWN